MNFNPALHKGLCVLAAGDDWAWAAAVVEAASGWNQLAVGDNNALRGLWQMDPTFLAWCLPEYQQNGEMLVVAHGDPFVQASAFRRFWAGKVASMQPADKLRVYHYTETGAANLLRAENSDPDGYVDKVRKIYAAIVTPATKAA